MKRILVCLDGTWNKPDTEETAADTNVLKLYRLAHKHDGDAQICGYFAGVGTSAFEKLAGGLFGIGLYDQIKDGYQFIVNQYQPGDQIIITGFSRGAFSARCLAGFISTCGILKSKTIDVADRRDRKAIDDLWSLYKHRNESQSNRQKLSKFVAAECHPQDQKAVAALGVWDTVGALGIPWEIFDEESFVSRLSVKERSMLEFLDTELPPGVARAYHAVALDERRVPFVPTLWTGPRLNDGTIHQVWFSGAHSNVGGGFTNTGLSDIALDWMIRHLRNSHALLVDDVRVDPDGLWRPVDLTTMDKKMGKLPNEKVKFLEPREVPPGSRLHPTAAQRMKGSLNHPSIPSQARFLGDFHIDPTT